MKYIFPILFLLATSCVSPRFQYEYCLTDPDVRKQAEHAGVSVEEFCHDLIFRDAE